MIGSKTELCRKLLDWESNLDQISSTAEIPLVKEICYVELLTVETLQRQLLSKSKCLHLLKVILILYLVECIAVVINVNLCLIIFSKLCI